VLIGVVYVGDVPEKLVEKALNLASSAHNFFHFKTLFRATPTPKGYDPVRRQYLGDVILEQLRRLTPPEGVDKVLGITCLDLYVRGLNFIFGIADVGGKCAVVSIYRLKPELYGLPPNPRLLTERLAKEITHELGHTLGLSHCKNPTCVMRFSNSVFEVDVKNIKFCAECLKKLRKTLGNA